MWLVNSGWSLLKATVPLERKRMHAPLAHLAAFSGKQAGALWWYRSVPPQILSAVEAVVMPGGEWCALLWVLLSFDIVYSLDQATEAHDIDGS